MIKTHNKHIAGFTMVELLIAMIVTTMLLAAVAIAFNASAISYQENEDIFKTINSARQALFRITTQLRTATAVSTTGPTSECALITADGSNITYRYNGDDNKLYLDSGGSSYLLCNNVTAMTFSKTISQDGTFVKNVLISMTVENNNISKTISTAAVVRRNL